MQNDEIAKAVGAKKDRIPFVLGISVFYGLAIGAIDTVIGIVSFRPEGFSSFWTLFLSFSAGAVVLTVLYLITFILGSISAQPWSARMSSDTGCSP